MHYFLCDLGVTHVNNLHAVIHINPCQVLLHTSSLPLLRWLALWAHEVMSKAWLTTLHVYKNLAQLKLPPVLRAVYMHHGESWPRQSQHNCMILHEIFSVSQRRSNLNRCTAHSTTLMYISVVTVCISQGHVVYLLDKPDIGGYWQMG